MMTQADKAEPKAVGPSTLRIDSGTVVRLLAAAGVRLVRLEFADLRGIARTSIVPLKRFGEVLLHGATITGSILHEDAWRATSAVDKRPKAPLQMPDFLFAPDLTTLAVLDPALAPGVARVVGDLIDVDGRPTPFSARNAVRRLVAAYATQGLVPRLGFEHEFFLFGGDGEPAGGRGPLAASHRTLFDPAFTDALTAAVASLGIEVDRFSAEYSSGQVEVSVAAKDGLAGPDGAFAFRTLVKEISGRHGYRASFMTRPPTSTYASGSHVHQSLIDRETEMNAFAGSGSELSDLARRFLAGQLAHAPELTALVAPTVNCAKRFRLGAAAPVFVCWDCHDRRVAVRVPRASGQATRLENRMPSAAANPYLVTAGLLAAGLDGILRGLDPPPPLSAHPRGAAPVPLPRTLDDALAALAADAPLRALVGEPLVDLFLQMKRREVARCRAQVADYDEPSFRQRVDPWETAEYGESL